MAGRTRQGLGQTAQLHGARVGVPTNDGAVDRYGRLHRLVLGGKERAQPLVAFVTWRELARNHLAKSA